MTPLPRPAEQARLHTRLMKCALELEAARAYWSRRDAGPHPPSARQAFEEYWFGARSLARVEVLLANLRVRFDAYPSALGVLRRWPAMSPETRKLVCHWHLALADPLYRAFTGDYLPERLRGPRPELERALVVRWVGAHGLPQWTLATHIQFASKLLSAAYSAGLIGSSRDPRPLTLPSVPDDALAYMVYLLRELSFEGTLLENPYLRSLGLVGAALEERLAGLASLVYRRQGPLVDFGWRHASLEAWAAARFADAGSRSGAVKS